MVNTIPPLNSLEPLLMRPGSKQQMYLNPDFAYLVWVKCKSLARAADFLKDQKLESYQGKPYTRQGIHLAAKKSKYYEQARKVILLKRRTSGRKN